MPTKVISRSGGAQALDLRPQLPPVERGGDDAAAAWRAARGVGMVVAELQAELELDAGFLLEEGHHCGGHSPGRRPPGGRRNDCRPHAAGSGARLRGCRARPPAGPAGCTVSIASRRSVPWCRRTAAPSRPRPRPSPACAAVTAAERPPAPLPTTSTSVRCSSTRPSRRSSGSIAAGAECRCPLLPGGNAAQRPPQVRACLRIQRRVETIGVEQCAAGSEAGSGTPLGRPGKKTHHAPARTPRRSRSRTRRTPRAPRPARPDPGPGTGRNPGARPGARPAGACGRLSGAPSAPPGPSTAESASPVSSSRSRSALRASLSCRAGS